jgi:hypothetical protein
MLGDLIGVEAVLADGWVNETKLEALDTVFDQPDTR